MKTALLLIDVQESFRQRPYWSTAELPAFLDASRRLIEGAQAQGMPIVRVFHSDGPRRPTTPSPWPRAWCGRWRNCRLCSRRWR